MLQSSRVQPLALAVSNALIYILRFSTENPHIRLRSLASLILSCFH